LLGEGRLADLTLKTALANQRLELRSVDSTSRSLDCGLLLSALVTKVP